MLLSGCKRRWDLEEGKRSIFQVEDKGFAQWKASDYNKRVFLILQHIFFFQVPSPIFGHTVRIDLVLYSVAKWENCDVSETILVECHWAGTTARQLLSEIFLTNWELYIIFSFRAVVIHSSWIASQSIFYGKSTKFIHFSSNLWMWSLLNRRLSSCESFTIE